MVSHSSAVPSRLIHAILHTVAYADIFDYPLTVEEIHRYLTGIRAPLELVYESLQNNNLTPALLQRTNQYYTLPGRAGIVMTRQQRERVASRLWPHALRYGRLIAMLPFVRMVAVTGSLAMNNSDVNGDIDYLIVTAPGRLWMCRLLALAVVRLASFQHVRLCPNYFISERVLEFPDHTLYAAHEFAQMAPVAGMDVYRQMQASNAWVRTFLPNVDGGPAIEREIPTIGTAYRLRALLEAILFTRLGGWIEHWEMERKIRKLSRQRDMNPEAQFTADFCKGHFNRHAQRTDRIMDERLHHLALELEK